MASLAAPPPCPRATKAFKVEALSVKVICPVGAVPEGMVGVTAAIRVMVCPVTTAEGLKVRVVVLAAVAMARPVRADERQISVTQVKFLKKGTMPIQFREKNRQSI